MAGFNHHFRFTRQKHICPALKDERRTDLNTENPIIKKENVYEKSQNHVHLGSAHACLLSKSQAVLARPVPTPTPTPTATPPLGEDRGNNNSAAEHVDALNTNTTGSYMTAHGWHALSANTTGSNNTANGSYALFSNMTGWSNTAVGAYSLQNNTTGSVQQRLGR